MVMLSEWKGTESDIVPSGWRHDYLENLSTTSSGTTPSRSAAERYYENGTIHWVKTMDLTNSDISTTEELVTKTALDETSLRVYPIGTVLIAMYGGFNQIGRTGLLKVPAAVNQAIIAIQVNPRLLVSKYLINILNYRVNYWKTVASSSRKDPNITSSDIKKFPIIFPANIKEQHTIATALSDVDTLVASLDKLIAKKRDIKQATMQQLLTGKTRLPGFSGEWQSFNMAHNSTLKARIGWQGLTTAEYLKEGKYYLVTGTDFIDGKIDWDTCHFVDAARYEQDKNIQLRIGDVLLTKDGTIGKAAYVNYLPGLATLNSGVFVIRPNDNKYYPLYLYYVLCSSIFDAFLKQLKAGSTISHLYQKDFVSFSFLSPSWDEQQAIATVLSDMDAEIAALEQKRAKTRMLKQGMMQELLTGKTRLV